ncbi:hypothetical protein VT84_04245 [Gemmata sp. SH-PL17]|uniref:hypothetical protein n=1 Tax=Gemmata sp. SH-PL17 TaxID=1630693 RepID=UPI0004B0D4B0|nr:hypothetical protein [Gemmata sp. SH-PL17]AMV23597.1 hypothetical protein VT84_04245 [Gemmata sp. SH-PL17]
MRAIFFAAATTVAVVLAGCGGDVPRGRVHGTIKYQGKPLTGATVIFIAQDSKTHVLDLKPDGTYDVSGVALGPIKVSIQTVAPRSAVKGEFDPPSSQAKGVTDEKAGKKSSSAEVSKVAGPMLPARFADADKSGLSFDLKEPDQEWSVDLK